MINLNLFFRSLSANLLQASSASRLSGLARAVAIIVSLSLGIGLFIGIEPLRDSSRVLDPKSYIRTIYSKDKALCLIKLYGKESAFKTDAIGNLNGSQQTYGIPQLKNPMIKDMSAYNQIDYGMKYIEHRYGTPCRAYAHWVKKGWH